MKRYYFIFILLYLVIYSCPAHAKKFKNSYSEPEKYTFEDLKSAAKSYRGHFSFYNYYQPDNAMAALPAQSPDGAPTYVTAAKIRRLRAQSWYYFYQFPWDDPHLKDGDIVFIRGGDKVSDIVRCFSTWTHTAMIYNKEKRKSYESQNINGVNYYDYETAWTNIVAYSAKRANIPNSKQAVINSANTYIGKPYFPSVNKSSLTLTGWFNKWSDKNDNDSMYCSKLVWLTYKPYIDLDSDRTTSILFGSFFHGQMDCGIFNWNAWIGVSPDDVYYSKNVGKDIVLNGQGSLNEPLADSIF
ncbi:hypothetical protein A2311_03065 [candidate division WOR-1 bacterium RIFOXYB2_FULL_48_7]|uniref:Amidase domain-containing protein n=1 Tax=candidate division WOR-1 bacterium RIFOXYB2_FULL_48_7 TaxID=1802583 RepID=A0A1F4TWL8_UNCSA|nr:MAG: hypothetical protein A2311_03065 [candidate division WOR-1 bacterium RIFOXYB2_FULL_48_7]